MTIIRRKLALTQTHCWRLDTVWGEGGRTMTRVRDIEYKTLKKDGTVGTTWIPRTGSTTEEGCGVARPKHVDLNAPCPKCFRDFQTFGNYPAGPKGDMYVFGHNFPFSDDRPWNKTYACVAFQDEYEAVGVPRTKLGKNKMPMTRTTETRTTSTSTAETSTGTKADDLELEVDAKGFICYEDEHRNIYML